MKNFTLLFAIVLIAVSVRAQKEPAPELKIDTISAFQTQIKSHIDEKRFEHCQWGIKIMSLDTGKLLFERNADKLMKPASNAKMYTGSMALDRLGPDFRIKTSFYAQ